MPADSPHAKRFNAYFMVGVSVLCLAVSVYDFIAGSLTGGIVLLALAIFGFAVGGLRLFRMLSAAARVYATTPRR